MSHADTAAVPAPQHGVGRGNNFLGPDIDKAI